MSEAAPHVIGLDVGGTKVAAGALQGTGLAERVEHPTDLSSGDALLAEMERAVREVAERTSPPDAVGVGIPSQTDYASGMVLSSVNIPLEGVSVKDELSRRLGVPVWVDNDANVAALAEAQMVDDPPAEHLVMLTLGTGVGGGVIVDGRIFRGATGLGAELGHVVIESNGPNCPGRCPNRGCLEALVSGTALERDATELAEDFPESALGRVAAESVGRVRGRDVVRLAREGDDQSLRLMERLGTFLGVGIANVIQAFEPQYVVIGGGLSQGSDLFLDLAIREAEARSLPVLYRNVRIGVARGGPDAGVIGAGVLAMQEHSRSVDTAGQSQTATEGVE